MLGAAGALGTAAFLFPLQLCEDLFSRVSKNQSAELSYSVEVSPGLGGQEGGRGDPG